MSSSSEDVRAELAAPFPADAIRWKPQAVNGNRAMAVGYVDAKTIMDRLDAVCGVGGWSDEYEVLPTGSVVCRLSLRFGIVGTGQPSDWICRSDVGSPSKQPDAGDKLKAAFTDAFKRAAVKWGVGRYLSRLPRQWVDYDPQKKHLASRPSLPAWAVPGGAKPQQAAPAAAPASESDDRVELVTPAEASELKALARQHNTDFAKFAAAYQIRRVEDLPAAHLEDAKRKITSGVLRKDPAPAAA